MPLLFAYKSTYSLVVTSRLGFIINKYGLDLSNLKVMNYRKIVKDHSNVASAEPKNLTSAIMIWYTIHFDLQFVQF